MRFRKTDEERMAESKTRGRVGRDEHERAFSAPVGRGETRDALNLRIVLPGVKPEDLRVAIERGTLQLNGERRPPIGFSENGRCHFAMPYGGFAQDIPLPDGLDTDRMETSLHEGVLDVHIPFKGAASMAMATVPGPGLPALYAAVAVTAGHITPRLSERHQ